MMRTVVMTGVFVMVVGAVAVSAPAEGSDVRIGIHVGVPIPPPPAIVLPAPPRLVIVPGSPVFYAPDADVTFFAYGGRFYTFHRGAWFVAHTHHGPWAYVPPRLVPHPVLAVPGRFYRARPDHWRGHGVDRPRSGHARWGDIREHRHRGDRGQWHGGHPGGPHHGGRH